MDKETCRAAARSGSLACLQYALQNGCPWDTKEGEIAARSGTPGHIECLKYMIENDFPWTWNESEAAAAGGNLTALKYIIDEVFNHRNECTAAARGGTPAHLECLKCLFENDFPGMEKRVRLVLKAGRQVILKF